MARLGSKTAAVAVVAAVVLLSALTACDDLNLKTLVEERVQDYVAGQNPAPRLVLKDGGTVIPFDGTAIWPDTIFQVVATKTLTIENQGNKTLNLAGPPYVGAISGSTTAYNPYAPAQFAITPGGSVSFDMDFTPGLPDLDYSAVFAVNSDDPVHPAYTFNAEGHSTQWHGSTAAVTSATTFYSVPQVALAGSTIYVSYLDGANGVKLRKSTDGGKSWTSVTMTGYVPTTSSYHSIAASGSNFHIFYMDTGPALRYAKSEFSGTNPNNVTSYSVNTNYQGIMNSAVVLSTNVYLCFNDTSNTRLRVATSSDIQPSSMTFSTYDVTGGATGESGGFHPSLKVVSGTAWLSYADARSVKFAKATTLSSWTCKTIYTDPSYNVGATALVTDGTKGVVLFTKAGTYSLHCSRTTNGGDTWSAPAALSTENAQLSVPLPFVAVGDTLYALYYSYGATSGIRLATSPDFGSSWSYQWLDTQVGTSGAHVSLAAVGSTVYAAYNTPSSHPHQYSITVMKSLDGGSSW